MYFIGGGMFGGLGCPSRGQYPRAAKNPLNPPPQPPRFKFGSRGGVLKQDIRFPRTPPPPALDNLEDASMCLPGGALALACAGHLH